MLSTSNEKDSPARYSGNQPAGSGLCGDLPQPAGSGLFGDLPDLELCDGQHPSEGKSDNSDLRIPLSPSKHTKHPATDRSLEPYLTDNSLSRKKCLCVFGSSALIALAISLALVLALVVFADSGASTDSQLQAPTYSPTAYQELMLRTLQWNFPSISVSVFSRTTVTTAFKRAARSIAGDSGSINVLSISAAAPSRRLLSGVNNPAGTRVIFGVAAQLHAITALEVSIKRDADDLNSIWSTAFSRELKAVGETQLGSDSSGLECISEDSTEAPTTKATSLPTDTPSASPTWAPTDAPSASPTWAPTIAPSDQPSETPTTGGPTNVGDTYAPTADPTTHGPSTAPTWAPTGAPSAQPTRGPTTDAPTTAAPTTDAPTTDAPTDAPTTAAPTTDAPTTDAPTDAPTTAAPTTDAPTTDAPTTDVPFPCPIGVTCTVPSGVYRLPASNIASLHRLSVTLTDDSAVLIPFGRSYHGHSWENVIPASTTAASSRRVASIPPELSCQTAAVCTVTVSNEASYKLDSVTETIQTADAQASRFLIKTSFGPTTETIQALSSSISTKGPSSALEQWIEDQVTTPPTYHRVYYRERTNPRLLSSIPLGSVRTACAIGSRWHRYAFTRADYGKVLTTAAVSGQVQILVDGVPRTEVSSFPEDNSKQPYTLCSAEEVEGGEISFGSDCSITAMSNPPIEFGTVDTTATWDLTTNQATLVDLDGMAGVKILQAVTATCNTVHRFLRYGGTYYKFDPRLQLLDNTLESPAVGTAQSSSSCPVVPKTFLNKATCVRHTTCAPVTFSSADVSLDEDTLQFYFSSSVKYVYRIAGLVPDASATPCGQASRWRRIGSSCTAETALDADTKATLVSHLRSSSDSNAYIRDIEASGTCFTTKNGVSTIGSQVQVDGDCWEHSHSDLFNVYDFSRWASDHDGNIDIAKDGKPNPITAFAEAGGIELLFPSSHMTSRWEDQKASFPMLGRFGDIVDFAALPIEAQTIEMAQRVSSTSAPVGLGVETCGSPGEVTNVPADGHRYKMWMVDKREPSEVEGWNQRYDIDNGQRTAWTTIALNAQDQLRQRVSWALSQIFTVGESGFPKKDQSENWHNYYDIFVRNAFGNFRDVLQQVSWSPVMASYLTFMQNKGLHYTNTFPDENYAREIMQLFSIGLHRLNMDGSPMLNDDSETILSYDNNDIMTFSRAWTGFDRQAFRSNIEAFTGTGSINWIDPMQIKVEWRDPFPKMDTLDGYIGDRVPLCSDLPARSFLRKNAIFEYLGADSNDQHLDLASSSSLYASLCAASASICTFPSTVVLPSNLACDGAECNVDTVRNVKLGYNGVAVFYQYKPSACVKLAFFDGNEAADKNGNRHCVHRQTALARPGCCEADRMDRALGTCEFPSERITFDSLEQRCNAASMSVCESVSTRTDNNCNIGGPFEYIWTATPCSVQAQVNAQGFVSIVHTANNGENYLNPNTKYAFQVPWKNNSFPQAANGCPTECVTQADTCLCNVVVADTSAHTDNSALPTLAELDGLLKVGSPAPDQFDSGDYSKCTTDVCQSVTGVEVYFKSGGSGTFDLDTIFKIDTARGGTMYLANKVSTVKIGTFEFRNPVHFLTFSERTIEEAEHETESVIDHFFQHPNTAPFISHLLIQRLATSNPSPRYIQTVAHAFTTGKFAGKTYSGQYGDLEATVNAILLDREASSPILDADPAHGKLREPLIKVLHLMRAMKYTPMNGRQEVEMEGMDYKIGMAYALSPTVFNYYLPDYGTGAIQEAKLHSPEAQLGTAPLFVGFMNGVSSLIRHGLTDCFYGFASDKWRERTVAEQRCTHDPTYNVDGQLTYSPSDTSASNVVAELDRLLTAGRLNSQATQVISGAYQSAIDSGNSAQEAFKVALQLMMATAEFHSTNLNALSSSLRPAVTKVNSDGRTYKAVVVIFMNGGADSHNMLVPHTCSGHDLYAEYASIRGSLALDKDEDLLEIDVPDRNQPCEKFGVHPSMSYIQQLYQDGDLTFLANIGALVEPVTKQEFEDKSKELPPNLFAHNFMQKSGHTLHAQDGAAQGVLGRITDDLASTSRTKPYKTATYSAAGNVKMIQGSHAASIVDRKLGATPYVGHDEFTDTIKDMLTNRSSESHFAETFSSLFESALDDTEELSSKLEGATLQTSFADDHLSQRLEQVAKLTKTRGDTERASFFVSLGGWDTHGNAAATLEANLNDLDTALQSFVAEMDDQGIWDDVAIVTMSDFGRTLTSNGLGNDHGWGGNSMVMSGSLDGKKILGEYPSALGDTSDLNIGRGRILPTIGWESVWYGIAQWMGVDDIDTALPNKANFASSQLFGADTLFK